MQPVLVVEDEPMIVMFIEDTLTEGGFQVEALTDGSRALSFLADRETSPLALVTDIRIGSVSGWDIATRARERFPMLPVVYVTGDSAAEWPAHSVPGSICLQKPFACAQLIAALTSQLNALPPGNLRSSED